MTKLFPYLSLLILSFVVLLAPFSFTKADENIEAKNYAILLSQPRHVKGSLNMLNSMKKDKTKLQFNKARVVLYGDAIHTVKKQSDIIEVIKLAQKNGVEIAVCNQALKRQKVSQEDLLPGIIIVEQAIYEMLRLKTLGYVSIDL